MRIKLSSAATLLSLALLALASTGCVPSLQRLIEDEDAVAEPGLVGTWVEAPDDAWRRLAPGERASGERWVVEASGETGYDVEFIGDADDAKPERFTARVARFSTGTYLELRADAEDCVDGELLSMHLISASTFYKIEIQGDILRDFVLDPSWLEQRLASRALRLPHVEVDGDLVLTASSKQLQRFIERHGNDAGAFLPRSKAFH